MNQQRTLFTIHIKFGVHHTPLKGFFSHKDAENLFLKAAEIVIVGQVCGYLPKTFADWSAKKGQHSLQTVK